MIRDPLPQLQSLVYFESAARLLNFTAAAAELGTTQPAVSHRVRQMEESLGIPLFRRQHRGVALTEEGRHMYQTVHDSLEAIRVAASEVSAARNHSTLTLLTDFGFAKFWLMPRLPALKARFPGIQLRVLTSQSELDARNDPVDLAIQFGQPSWGRHPAIRLFDERVVPVCSPALLAAHGGVCSDAADLARLPLLHLEGGEPGRWLAWADWFAAQPQEIPRRTGPSFHDLGFNDYSLVIQAALAGQGVALGWSPLVDDLLESGQLVKAVDRPLTTERGYFLVTPGQRRRSRVWHQFHDWIMEACAASAGEC